MEQVYSEVIVNCSLCHSEVSFRKTGRILIEDKEGHLASYHPRCYIQYIRGVKPPE